VLCVLLGWMPTALAAASQRAVLRTDDGVAIHATFYEPSVRPAPAVILVHMLSRSRRDWDAVASRLAAEGIGALIIDLRGHGDSAGVPSDLERMTLDVKAARQYLNGRGDVRRDRIGLAGASLGASLAALYAASDPAVQSIALLSPTLDYRGLRIEAAMKSFGGRAALLVASIEDSYAARSAKALAAMGANHEVVLLDHAGHGTNMLIRDPSLVRRLVDWFRRTLL
jgi:alpha-beta hydrolase superfamily lysophospholipase